MSARHDLVWLTRSGWGAALEQAPQHDAVLRDWFEHDWPLVVRRQEPGAGDAVLSLGMPLPLAEGVRQRVALVVQLAQIARQTPPLTIADALACAPSTWLAPLLALQRDFTGLDLRVYGSLAMESITGLPYLRPESDIDLLLRPATRAELHAGAALLAQHAQLLPLDGEIVFPNGDAVSWKEWSAARRDGARVLVKSLHSVRLADPVTLEAELA